MRLDNQNFPKTRSVGDADGSDLGDGIGHASETSSLDIKVANGAKMTTPPSKNGQKRQIHSGTKEQQHYRRAGPDHQHRAARGGRLPSQAYDEMGDPDLLQALYEDPALLAAKASGGPKKGPRSRRRAKSDDDYPDHVKSMINEGFPVTQWIILLLVLGGIFYKVKMGIKPAATSAKATTKRVTEGGISRKNGRQKGKKGQSRAKAKGKDMRLKAPKSNADMEDLAEEEVKPEKMTAAMEQSQNATTKIAPKTKSTKQKARKRNSASKKKVDENGSHESPDSVSTDGSSSAEVVPQSEEDHETMADLLEESQLSPEQMRVKPEANQLLADDEDEGWQTVRTGADKQRRKSNQKEQQRSSEAVSKESQSTAHDNASAQVSPEHDVADASQPNAEEVGVAPLETPDIEKEEVVEPAAETHKDDTKENVASSPAVMPESSVNKDESIQNVKKSKKKKSKKNDKASSSVPMEKATDAAAPNRIDDDEALALKLQQEEDDIARSSPVSNPTVEEVWEEVSKSRKKKKNAQPVEE